MSLIRILMTAAAIALVMMGAQTYALTKIFKPADIVEQRSPHASARETLEYLNEYQRDPDVRPPFGARHLDLPFSGDRSDTRNAL